MNKTSILIPRISLSLSYPCISFCLQWSLFLLFRTLRTNPSTFLLLSIIITIIAFTRFSSRGAGMDGMEAALVLYSYSSLTQQLFLLQLLFSLCLLLILVLSLHPSCSIYLHFPSTFSPFCPGSPQRQVGFLWGISVEIPLTIQDNKSFLTCLLQTIPFDPLASTDHLMISPAQRDNTFVIICFQVSSESEPSVR